MRIPKRAARLWWRIVNPLQRLVAGWLPLQVLLETTGCKTGERRRTPLAAGPVDGDAMYLVSVHGAGVAWVRNIAANPRVRLQRRGKWREGTAEVVGFDNAVMARFGRYPRTGVRLVGDNPSLVRITFTPRG